MQYHPGMYKFSTIAKKYQFLKLFIVDYLKLNFILEVKKVMIDLYFSSNSKIFYSFLFLVIFKD